MCDMTHSYVWHASFVCVIRPMYIIRMFDRKWQVSFAEYRLFYRALLQKRPITHDACVTNDGCVIGMCDPTRSYAWHERSYAWHDSFMCVIRPIYMCDTTNSFLRTGIWVEWNDSFIYVTCLMHICDTMCDMTHLYVWHDSFIYVKWLIHICEMTNSYM